MSFKFLGLACDLGSVIIFAYMNDLTAGLSGSYKTSGEQLVPFGFRKIVRLAGKEGFIYFYTSFQDFCIRRNLIAAFQTDNIVQNQFFRGNRPFLSLADHHGFSCSKNRQLVNSLLCPDLLGDSDKRIDHDDHYKKSVSVRSHHEHKNKKHQIQKVKKCQRILSYDLLIRSGIRILVNIYPALFYSLTYLFVC